MKTSCVLFCVLATVGAVWLAGQLSDTLRSERHRALAAVQRLPTETAGGTTAVGTTAVNSAPANSSAVGTAAVAAAVVPTQELLSRVDQLLEQHAAATANAAETTSATAEPNTLTAAASPPTTARPAAVRHVARLHPEMITPGNFEYLGAFRLPHGEFAGSAFAYGGWALAWRPPADTPSDQGSVSSEGRLPAADHTTADSAAPARPARLPGSLFIVGHREQQLVAEISIPEPVISRLSTLDQLREAEVLQPFADVTAGLLRKWNAASETPFHIGGLAVVGQQLHWTIHKYYNVQGQDLPSHGTCSLQLSDGLADGPWHLGPQGTGQPEWHSYKHAGYILEVPEPTAQTWLNGCRLLSGLQISTGLQFSSQGPALFAYQLPEPGTAAGTSLPAIPLVWYSEQAPLAQHHPADRWTGAAWLTLGDRQAVVIAGRKSLGPVYYGEARPGDCSQDKGYHGAPYEAQLLFYSPASLIHAAHGQLSAQALAPWLRWDSQFDGGGLSQYLFRTCSQEVGGMAYDRDRNLLYLVQINAGYTSDNEFEPLPVIHVFRITS